MKKSKFSNHQILSILKQHEAGVPVAELSREQGISTALIYQSRSKYGGMDASENVDSVIHIDSDGVGIGDSYVSITLLDTTLSLDELSNANAFIVL